MSDLAVSVQDFEKIQKAMEAKDRTLSAISEHLSNFQGTAQDFILFQQQLIETLPNIEKLYLKINTEALQWRDTVERLIVFQINEYPEIQHQSHRMLDEIKNLTTNYKNVIKNSKNDNEIILSRIMTINKDFEKMLLNQHNNINDLLEDFSCKINASELVDNILELKLNQNTTLNDINSLKQEIKLNVNNIERLSESKFTQQTQLIQQFQQKIYEQQQMNTSELVDNILELKLNQNTTLNDINSLKQEIYEQQKDMQKIIDCQKKQSVMLCGLFCVIIMGISLLFMVLI